MLLFDVLYILPLEVNALISPTSFKVSKNSFLVQVKLQYCMY